MWTDTHCHLEAPELAEKRDSIARKAADMGVSRIVIPSIDRNSFDQVRQLAHQHPNCAYALGIHPVYIPDATEEDLSSLRSFLATEITDPRLVAIGEIGLDFFIPELKEGPLLEKQMHFYIEQLKIAREFELPVLLHSRRSVDIIIKHLRQIKTPGGIAHAFNGSLQQAQSLIDLGFMLSFCGTFTYERAQHLRRLATTLPLHNIVIETDSPDLSPAWLSQRPNTPEELPRIGEELARLRGISPTELAQATTENALTVMPKLRNLPLEISCGH